ncbi:MAG: biotin/lipoyl-binding protein, partial [Ignavibacteriae bacterium]|nr:biotin/lipoyl-binding protein [Ignavibacteriota bacterium]
MTKKEDSFVKKLFKSKIFWVVITILFLLSLCIFFTSFSKKETDELTAYTVERVEIFSSVSADGYVDSNEKQLLSFGVSGRISALNVNEGDRVTKGAIIATIDKTPYEAQLRGAQGSLQSASASYSKLKNSLDIEIQKLSTQISEYDKQLAEYSQTATEQLSSNSVDRSELNVALSQENLQSAKDSKTNLEDEVDQIEKVSAANEDLSYLSG